MSKVKGSFPSEWMTFDELEVEYKKCRKELADLKQLVGEFRKEYSGDSAINEYNAWHRLSQKVED